MAAHAHAHHADLRHLAVRNQTVEADRILAIFEQRHGPVQIGGGHGEGHISFALVLGDVLDDHVDIDVGLSQRPENRGHRAGAVRNARKRHLGLVLVSGDAGDQLAFHFQILHFLGQFFVGHDHGAGNFIGKRGIVINEG